MATGKTGKSVWYQPTAQEWPQSRNQQAAIITSWDEEAETASLVIFPPGAAYVLEKSGVVEGSADGNFQQPSVESDTFKLQQQNKANAEAAAAAQQKAQAHEASASASQHSAPKK